MMKKMKSGKKDGVLVGHSQGPGGEIGRKGEVWRPWHRSTKAGSGKNTSLGLWRRKRNGGFYGRGVDPAQEQRRERERTLKGGGGRSAGGERLKKTKVPQTGSCPEHTHSPQNELRSKPCM